MTFSRVAEPPIQWLGMPPRRPHTAANDNSVDATPLQRYAWDVYRAAVRARWIGRVIASNADEAVESAAIEFSTDVRKPIAVRRFEVAS